MVFVVGPYHRRLVGLLLSPHVHHVVSEVEVLRYLEVEVPAIVFLR